MTVDTPGRTGEGLRWGALVRTFLTRLFENDITGGANDLKTGYFSLLAFLAAPPFLLAIMTMNLWENTARVHGIAVLHEQSLSGKVLYLSFGMVAAGILTAMTWSNLLLDRRDALILGALPVRPQTIVRGKLAALGVYLAVLALAMHGLASFSFGVGLAVGNTLTFLVRGVIAHFVAATSASLFLILTVTALQGVILTLTGPRVFSRISSALQIALIAGVLVVLVTLPLFAVSTLDTLAGSGRNNRPWMLWTPAFWFLGTYEVVLGTDRPILIALHWRGVAALACVIATILWSYASAYRRLARAAVEGGDTPRPRRAAALNEVLTRSLTSHPASRAAAQFFLISLARVERLRFVLAVAVGIILGLSAPVLFFLAAGLASSSPPTGLLALSLAVVALLACGIRIAASLPCDLGAAWIVPAVDPAPARMRAATWRVHMALGVLPIVVLFGLLHAWYWGLLSAAQHALVLVASGAFLIEILLWNHERMPGTNAWRPERLELDKRWPLYGIAFLLFSLGIASIETLVLDMPALFAVFLGALVALAAGVRVAHQRRLVMPVADDEVVGAPAVLRLDS